MRKQNNSAKKMENSSKPSQETISNKEPRKIDDYFNFGNKKRNRDENENSKDEGILKISNKIDNQSNNIAPNRKDKFNDLKSIRYLIIITI